MAALPSARISDRTRSMFRGILAENRIADTDDAILEQEIVMFFRLTRSHRIKLGRCGDFVDCPVVIDDDDDNDFAEYLASPSAEDTLPKEIILPKDTNSRAYRKRALRSLHLEDFSIPQTVADALHKFHLSRPSVQNNVVIQSPADYYEYTCNVETDLLYNRILWRFLTTSYHDLISGIGNTLQRCSDPQNVGVAFVVNAICQTGKHDLHQVQERVKGWAKIGRRYRGYVDALCSGCLILFPHAISDNVWVKHVPMKGKEFDDVTQRLRELGLIFRCEQEGWNDLGEKIFQTLREPFQLQSGLKSQIGGVACASQIVHERTTPSSRKLRVTKTKHKKLPRERERWQLEMHYEDGLLLFPQGVVTDRRRDALSNISLNTASVSSRVADSVQHIPDQGWIPPEYPPGSQHQGQRTEASTSESLRLGRSGISTINALLNYDTLTTAPSFSAHGLTDSIEPIPDITGKGDAAVSSCVPVGTGQQMAFATPPVSVLGAIQIETSYLQQLLVDRPADILGDIWFGSLPGFPPFVSLRLSQAMGEMIKPSGREVFIRSPAPEADRIIEGVYSMNLDIFMELFRRDGFGGTFWNETKGDSFVSIEVLNERLITDFFQACKQAN